MARTLKSKNCQQELRNEISQQTRIKTDVDNLCREIKNETFPFINFLQIITEYHEVYKLRKFVMDHKTVGDFKNQEFFEPSKIIWNQNYASRAKSKQVTQWKLTLNERQTNALTRNQELWLLHSQ